MDDTKPKAEMRAKLKRSHLPLQGLYKCAGCRKPFTVNLGTIFEDSDIPLNKWVINRRPLCEVGVS